MQNLAAFVARNYADSGCIRGSKLCRIWLHSWLETMQNLAAFVARNYAESGCIRGSKLCRFWLHSWLETMQNLAALILFNLLWLERVALHS
jgi:hypothetical protein